MKDILNLFLDQVEILNSDIVVVSFENGFNYTSWDTEFSVEEFSSFVNSFNSGTQPKNTENSFITSIVLKHNNGGSQTFYFDEETESWIEGE